MTSFTLSLLGDFFFSLFYLITLSATSGSSPDLNNKTHLFQALQAKTHVVGNYFDLHTQSYFKDIMGHIFGVDMYCQISWYGSLEWPMLAVT